MTNPPIKVIILSVILIFLVKERLLAQFTSYSNDFLNISANARSSAMANANLNSTQPANSLLINPANLLNDTTKYQFALSHQNLFGQLALMDYAGFSMYKNNTAFSAAILRVGVDNIQNTLSIKDSLGNLDFNNINYFSSADFALLFGMAHKIEKYNLVWGLAAKIIYRHYGNFAYAAGFGLDAGLHYSYKKWNFATNLSNLGGTYTFWKINQSAWPQQISDSIMPNDFKSLEISPQKLSIGINRVFKLTSKFQLSTEFDLESILLSQENAIISNQALSIYPKIGAELSYNKHFFARFGFNDFQKYTTMEGNSVFTQKMNLGFGMVYKFICIDYALSNLSNYYLLPSSHLFSLYVSLNKLTRANSSVDID
jgi:hypothetical protein